MTSPLVLFLSLLVALAPSGDMTREEVLQALRDDHHRAAAGHCPYEVPQVYDSRAPKGFKPVYVSHYGRHGSRFQGSRQSFEKVLPVLDSLYGCHLLTGTGDSLRYELHQMYEAHEDKDALLTRKGGREQSGVAQRLCDRVPGLFRQKDAREVSVLSTSAVRCLQSMAYFTASVKGFSSDVDVVYNTGLARNLHYLAPRYTKDDKEFVISRFVPLQDSLLAVAPGAASAAERFFKDPDNLRVPGRTLNRFVYELYEAAQGAGCLDIDVDPLRFFSPEELFDFLEIRNLYFCAHYGPLAPTKDLRSKYVIPLLRGIIKDADAALAGNGRCADFRFGHDGGLGPLLMLVGVEGFDREVDPGRSLLQWQAWKYIPMCSNFQMIFYRNNAGQVLVKFLRNENEVMIPQLQAAEGVYYRWQDVRRYLLVRTGDYSPLPDYYAGYLDAKAEEIKELKRDEADGFFFWTDSHFPDNAGNVAAVLEYLQGKIGAHKLFNGGDVAKNAETLEDGMTANTSALLQAGLYGTLFPVRGNHDFTSTTSRAVSDPETMGNLEVARYLSSFRSPVSVTDQRPHTNYFYVDSPEGRIRYIVFDSTDSVSDARIRYGISDGQMDWIMRQAVATVPKGWSIMFLSHVPFAPDHTDHPSLIEAGKKMSRTGNVLLGICGHRHTDMESGIGSVFQVLTAADCLEDVGRTATPYSRPLPKKKAGTVSEQTVDYVSISRRHDKVTMKRIGWGYDRIFNIRPVFAKVGQTTGLEASRSGRARWYVFDAQGNSVGKYDGNGMRNYVTSHRNASVSDDGLIECKAPGNVIAVALYDDGTKEYFMVSIAP